MAEEIKQCPVGDLCKPGCKFEGKCLEILGVAIARELFQLNKATITARQPIPSSKKVKK